MLAETLPRQRTLPALAWTGAGIFAFILAQLVGVLVYIAGVRLTHSDPLLSTYRILNGNLALLASVVFSTAAVVPFLWGLTRIRTRNVAGYLALQWPTRHQFAVGIVSFIVFMITLTLVSHRLETSSDVAFLLDEVSSARAAHAIPLLSEAVVLAAPIGEELVFRGFLYRTLELRFGGIAAIIVTALGWAALHIQYSLAGMVAIFAGGLFFGAIRRYSGSLYVTILMHALWNGFALAGALLMLPKA